MHFAVGTLANPGSKRLHPAGEPPAEAADAEGREATIATAGVPVEAESEAGVGREADDTETVAGAAAYTGAVAVATAAVRAACATGVVADTRTDVGR